MLSILLDVFVKNFFLNQNENQNVTSTNPNTKPQNTNI